MTFKELQDLALGDDFREDRRTLAKQFINDALGRMHRAGARLPLMDKRTLIVTEAGSNVYDPPDDFVSLAGDEALLLDTDVLEPVDISGLDQISSVPGPPAVFAFSEGRFLLSPVPDGVYTLTLRYRGTEQLVEDGETPTLTPEKHAHLGLFARAKLYLLTDDPEMHASLLATLPRELQVNLAEGNPVPRVRRIPGTWSDMKPAAGFRHPQGLF